jgi:hypothetical protein
MKNTKLLIFLLLLILPAVLQAQLTYITNNGTITITGYTGGNTGPSYALNIPSTINNLAVTSIADFAFNGNNLTSLIIGTNVINIGNYAFYNCTMTNIVTIPNSVTTVGVWAFAECSHLSGVKIGNSVTNIGDYAFDTCTSLTGVKIGNSVASIGDYAFAGCTGVTNITFPNSLTNIWVELFYGCTNLNTVYFQGNAPNLNADGTFFTGVSAIVYYLPATTGWGATFDGLPTVLWNPHTQNDASFGVQNKQFGFNIIGTTNIPIVVEASTDFGGDWVQLQSISLTNGSFYFSDSQWTNYPARFYRFRSP